MIFVKNRIFCSPPCAMKFIYYISHMKYGDFERLDPQGLAAGAAFLEALAHPVRLRIASGLLSGECGVGSMAECLGLPQAFVSRHLAILRRAGVVHTEIRGRERAYRVIHPAIPGLVALLQEHFPK